MKIFYYCVIRIYIVWCRVYRFFERKTSGYEKFKSEFKQKIIDKSIFQKWDIVLNTIHYENDKPYQLWDVTSDPYCALKRGWGDCDDYSAIAYTLFKGIFDYRNVTHSYVGTFYLLYGFSGHVISIWMRILDGKYLVVSTKAIDIYNSIEDILIKQQEEKKIKCIAYVEASNINDIFDVKFKSFFSIKEFNNLLDELDTHLEIK